MIDTQTRTGLVYVDLPSAGELLAAEGVAAVHANDTSNFERAEVSSRLGRIFTIRYELFMRKFLVKFLNNFLAQLTPFLFYSIGGYFALRGSIDTPGLPRWTRNALTPS